MSEKRSGRTLCAPTDYTALVPFTPPEGLLDWALETCKGLQHNEMIYSMEWVPDPITGLKHREVDGWCSACGKISTYDYYGGSSPYGFIAYAEAAEGRSPVIRKAGEETVCPCCGANVTAVHCGSFREHTLLGGAWPMTVNVIEIPGEGRMPVLTGWRVEREIRKHGSRAWQVHTSIWPYEAYVVERKKLVRLKGYVKYFNQVYFQSEWIQVKRGTDEWGVNDVVFPWKPGILEGSSAENSKLDLYLRTGGKMRPVSYLALWLKHKNVENLVVQGAGTLLNDMMDHAVYTRGYYGEKCSVGRLTDVDWKQKRPARMLGLNNDEFRQVLRLRLDTWGLRMLLYMKAEGQALRSDEDVLACKTFGCRHVMEMAKEGLPVLKVIRYLDRQLRRWPKEKDRIKLSELRDYWSMAQQVGDELQDPRIRWPQHLTSAHDGALLRMRFREKPELVAQFAAVLQQLTPLEYREDGILIRPCRTENELILEGKYLHHCVASYAKTHAEGKTCIFFLRREAEPDKPWYTLELDLKSLKVLQNRGKYNCARTAEVQAFEQRWLKHIREINTERKVSA